MHLTFLSSFPSFPSAASRGRAKYDEEDERKQKQQKERGGEYHDKQQIQHQQQQQQQQQYQRTTEGVRVRTVEKLGTSEEFLVFLFLDGGPEWGGGERGRARRRGNAECEKGF